MTEIRIAKAKLAPRRSVKTAVWVRNPGPIADVAIRKAAPIRVDRTVLRSMRPNDTLGHLRVHTTRPPNDLTAATGARVPAVGLHSDGRGSTGSGARSAAGNPRGACQGPGAAAEG